MLATRICLIFHPFLMNSTTGVASGYSGAYGHRGGAASKYIGADRDQTEGRRRMRLRTDGGRNHVKRNR